MNTHSTSPAHLPVKKTFGQLPSCRQEIVRVFHPSICLVVSPRVVQEGCRLPAQSVRVAHRPRQRNDIRWFCCLDHLIGRTTSSWCHLQRPEPSPLAITLCQRKPRQPWSLIVRLLWHAPAWTVISATCCPRNAWLAGAVLIINKTCLGHGTAACQRRHRFDKSFPSRIITY